MAPVRTAFLEVADYTVALLRDPSVASNWDEQSALAEMTVGALAGHLARQVLNVQRVLAVPAVSEPPISLLEHYARVTWIEAGLQDAPNVVVRQADDDEAAVGPTALAANAARAADELREQLPAEPAGRVVLLPWGPWSLTLDDMLITRIMEIAVHSDDLAVSIGLPAVQLPEAAADIAAELLVKIAMRRHGQAAILRALSRAERAPRSIVAF
jgi:hypothetical protein